MAKVVALIASHCSTTLKVQLDERNGGVLESNTEGSIKVRTRV